jgi:hypothetical protein
MTIADRYRRAAEGFSARVDAVPGDAWRRPAPCEGWVARDVVAHLVEWVPAFFAGAGGPDLAARTPVTSTSLPRGTRSTPSCRPRSTIQPWR